MALFVERPVEWFGDVPFALFCLLASIIFAGFLSVLLSTLLSVLRMRGMSLLASQASILNDCKKVLHQALENAVKWNVVPRNVAKLVTLPRVERYDAQTLTVEQAKRLLEAARGSRIEVMILVALNTGMRRGELSALRWDDIDFQNEVIFVHRTVNYVGGYGFVETEPKTRASKRKIAISETVLGALKVHRERQEQMRLKAGEKWCEQGIVFCNMYGGFMYPQVIQVQFHALLVKAGLPDMRFHDLRHTMATMLLEADVHPKKVQERLGHSTIAITMDTYSHVLPSMHQDVARKLDDLFKE